MALARSRGSVNSVIRMPRLTAAAMALPRPCRNRAAISTSGDPANPASREAPVKTPVPARNIRLRPMRSPSRPARSSRLPKAIR